MRRLRHRPKAERSGIFLIFTFALRNDRTNRTIHICWNSHARDTARDCSHLAKTTAWLVMRVLLLRYSAGALTTRLQD
jgi:hypothetical protein